MPRLHSATYGIVPYSAHMWSSGPEAQREGVLPTVVAEQYAQLLVEVDGTWASRRVGRREAGSSILSFLTAPFLRKSKSNTIKPVFRQEISSENMTLMCDTFRFLREVIVSKHVNTPGAEANHTAASLLQSSWCHRWPGPKLPAKAPASAAKGRTLSTFQRNSNKS